MARAFRSAAGTGDVAASAITNTPSGGQAKLMGWSVRETAGAVATVNIEDGDGNEVGVINLAAAGSDTQWFGPQGVDCNNGIAIDRLTGTTLVVLYIA